MIQLRKASKQDLPIMVELSRIKRLDYEKAQPQFWRALPHQKSNYLTLLPQFKI